MSRVLTERLGPTWLVTLNRPEVRNCVDGETARALRAAVEEFRRDEALRVMVLTGAGGNFSSGFDLKAAEDLLAEPGTTETGPLGITWVTDLEKPVIGAVEGWCVAGGLELALWCDFRVAGEGARFGVLNRRFGVPLVDGGTQRLRRVVGLGNALYLILTGAVVDAHRAREMGLVQEVVPAGQALPRALELAEAMARYPQTSLLRDRQAVLEGLSLPLAAGLALEWRLHQASLRSPEMEEGLRRYRAGDRPPPPTAV